MGRKRVATEIGTWDFERVGEKLYRFGKTNATQRKYRITAVTGPRWLLGLVSLESGSYEFLRDGVKVSPPGKQRDSGLRPPYRWGVYYPPYSLCIAELDHPRTLGLALWGPEPAPPGAPAEAVLFEAPDLPFPATTLEASRFLRAGRSFQEIESASKPSAPSLKLKRLIDRLSGTRIAEHADALGISHAQLTRGFKREYGVTPVVYRSTLRVEEGILRLLEGRSTLEACHEAGFSDLSRFNRTMKKVTTVPPSRFKTALLRSSPRVPR